MVTATDKKELKLSSTDVQVSLTSEQHPNKLKFTATFALIDSPSDGTPYGAEEPVFISMDEAQKSIDSMNLMGIDCTWDEWWPEYCLTGHDTRNKIGVVEKAYIEGKEMKIDGLIYSSDFDDIAFFIKNATPALGFSMECFAQSTLEDDGYEHLHGITFTGVAILFSNLAAFEDTYLEYVAAKKKGNNELTKEEMEQLMASFEKIVDDKLAKVEASKSEPAKVEGLDEMKSEMEEMKKQLEASKAEVDKAKTENAEAMEKVKAEYEQKLADIQAKRKSEQGRKGLAASDDNKSIWEHGYHDGIKMMFSKIKDTMSDGGKQ